MLINAMCGKVETKGHIHMYMYIYMQALNMQRTYVFIHSLIHLITVVEILLYPELEIEKCFILPEGERMMGGGGDNDMPSISK